MKKIISIMLTLAVLMSSFCMTALANDEAATETNGSGLVFELDISRYATEGVISNKVEDTPMWFVEGEGKKDTTVTEVRTIGNGEKFSYMSFAPGATSFDYWKNGKPISAAVDESVLGQHELTFETWVRSTPFSGRWDRIFSLGSEAGNCIDVEINESATQFRLGLGNSGGEERKIISDRNMWNGEWQHLVISRKWDNGTLTASVYVNGELLGTETVENAPDPADWETLRWDDNPDFRLGLGIGGQRDGNSVFHGDIASFKVYNKNLSEADISANFEAGKITLESLVVSELDLSAYDGTAESIVDNGASGNYSSVSQSDYVKKGTYTNSKGEEVPYIDTYSEAIGETTHRGRAWIDNDAFGDLEDYTVGVWAKIPDHTKRSWGTIFSHTDHLGYDSKIFGSEFSENSFFLRSGDVSGGYVTIEPYQDTWAYYTFTKKWTKNENNEDVVTLKAYINGQELTGATVSGVCDKAGLMGYRRFAFGTFFPSTADGGTLTDIASFAVYNKAFSSEEIVTEYEAMRADYEEYFKITSAVSELDLSAYDGTAESISDIGISGKTSSFAQSDYVKKGTYINLKGEEVPYIDTYSEAIGETTYRGRAWIDNDAFGELEDYTVGAWAKIPDHTKRSWGTIFSHTDHQGYDSKIFGSEFSENSFFLRSGNVSGGYATIEPYQDTWAYYTFTKKWTKNENNEDVVILKAYINGQELTGATVSGVCDKAGLMGYRRFGFGTFFPSTADGGTLIDFASFAVYNKAFSSEEIEAEYLAMRDDYTQFCEIDVNFDNFDGYNASTLSNRNQNTEATFTLLGSEITPEAKSVKEITTVNGTKKVLSVDQSKSNRLLVTTGGISNQDEISVEMWVKFISGWGRFFCASSKTDRRDGGDYMDTWIDENENGSINFRPFGNDSADSNFDTVYANGFKNQWSHFVFNRKLVTDDDGNTQYVAEIYLNGVLADRKTYQREITPEDYLTFTVMGTGEGQQAKADLGSFIVRNKVLSDEEITNKYISTCGDYTEYCEIDVNFDNFDGYNVSTLSNNYTDTVATFKLLGDEITPEAKSVKEIATVNGAKKVLSADHSKDNRLLVTADGISNQAEVSVEMWAKYKGDGFGRLFTATPQDQRHDGGHYIDAYIDAGEGNGRLMYYPLGNDTADNDKLIYIYDFLNKWTHFVFNRKLVTDADGNNQYIVEIYKNGELVAKETYQNALVSEKYMTFTILGCGYAASGKTDMGSFKVRNKVLSAEEVAAGYQSEAADYKEASVIASATKSALGGYDVSVNNVTSENISCEVFIAAYEKETNAFAGCATGNFENGIVANSSASKNLSIEGLDANKSYEFKLFVWDSADSMKPYVNPVSFE